jgi:hypothetical protein
MTTVRPRISRATGLTAALAAVALIAAACSSSGLSAQEKAIRKTGNVTLKHACTASLCSGTRAGAAFQIQLPQDTKKWNGTLVIWSHGYREAAPIVSNPLDPSGAVQTVDRSAQDAPSTAVANALLAQGYALAGSAFATNGWDVLDGVNADQDLYTYFSSTFGKPDRVYIWGASLGGLITQTLAEKNLDWVSGVAPLCGVLGGTNLNLDLALDVAYAVKQLVYPQFKISGYSSVDEAVAQWEGASKALVSLLEGGSAAGVADVFAIGAIAGAPAKTEMFDGSSITSSIEALGEGIINALGYSTWGRYDLEQRVGGNPSQNTERTTTPVSPRTPAHCSPVTSAGFRRPCPPARASRPTPQRAPRPTRWATPRVRSPSRRSRSTPRTTPWCSCRTRTSSHNAWRRRTHAGSWCSCSAGRRTSTAARRTARGTATSRRTSSPAS